MDGSVANGTLCTIEHVADIYLGSILHFNRAAAETKLSLSIAEKENKAFSAVFYISIDQLLNSNNVYFLPTFTLSTRTKLSLRAQHVRTFIIK